MEQLNNPFVVYGYKGAEYFCDRSSVGIALKALLRRELVYKDREGYIVYDRFFSMWLRKNGVG